MCRIHNAIQILIGSSLIIPNDIFCASTKTLDFLIRIPSSHHFTSLYFLVPFSLTNGIETKNYKKCYNTVLMLEFRLFSAFNSVQISNSTFIFINYLLKWLFTLDSTGLIVVCGSASKCVAAAAKIHFHREVWCFGKIVHHFFVVIITTNNNNIVFIVNIATMTVVVTALFNVDLNTFSMQNWIVSSNFQKTKKSFTNSRWTLNNSQFCKRALTPQRDSTDGKIVPFLCFI